MPATQHAEHIGMTDIKKLHARGAAAFRSGAKRDAPYGEGSVYRRYWLEGFDAAREDNPITVTLTAKERLAVLEAIRIASEDGSIEGLQRDVDRAARKLKGR